MSTDNQVQSTKRISWRTIKAWLLSTPFRVGIIALLVWIGWSTVTSLQELLRIDQKAGQSGIALENELISPVIPTEAIAREPDEGHWIFAGWNWRIGRVEISTGHLEERFDELKTSHIERLDVPEESELELIEVLRRLSPETRSNNGREVYRYDAVDARLQVVAAEVERTVQLQSVAVALRQSDGRWQLLELLPVVHSAKMAGKTGQLHLLPLPRDSKRLVGRWKRDDLPQLEIATLSQNVEELTVRWRSDGWILRDSGHNAPLPGKLWQRDDRIIYTWTPDTGKTIRTLVLVDMSQQ